MDKADNNKNLHDLIINHSMVEYYPHLLRGYREGYLEPEIVLDRLDRKDHTHSSYLYPQEDMDGQTTLEVLFEGDEESFTVKKDGEELITFDRGENMGDTFYGVISLLKSLGFKVNTDE